MKYLVLAEDANAAASLQLATLLARLSFAAPCVRGEWFDLLACHCLILCAIQRLVISSNPMAAASTPELKAQVDAGADWLNLAKWFQDFKSETKCFSLHHAIYELNEIHNPLCVSVIYMHLANCMPFQLTRSYRCTPFGTRIISETDK